MFRNENNESIITSDMMNEIIELNTLYNIKIPSSSTKNIKHIIVGAVIGIILLIILIKIFSKK